MNEWIQKLASVVNTLLTLKIESTYDNMNKLMGCITTLDDMIRQMDSPPVEEQKDPGPLENIRELRQDDPEVDVEIEEISPEAE